VDNTATILTIIVIGINNSPSLIGFDSIQFDQASQMCDVMEQ
jgi:hypothetical protein